MQACEGAHHLWQALCHPLCPGSALAQLQSQLCFSISSCAWHGCRLMSEFGPGSLPCDVGSFGSLSGLDKVQNVDFTAVGLTGSLPDSWSSGFGSLQKLVRSLL